MLCYYVISPSHSSDLPSKHWLLCLLLQPLPTSSSSAYWSPHLDTIKDKAVEQAPSLCVQEGLEAEHLLYQAHGMILL